MIWMLRWLVLIAGGVALGAGAGALLTARLWPGAPGAGWAGGAAGGLLGALGVLLWLGQQEVPG